MEKESDIKSNILWKTVKMFCFFELLFCFPEHFQVNAVLPRFVVEPRAVVFCD